MNQNQEKFTRENISTSFKFQFYSSIISKQHIIDIRQWIRGICLCPWRMIQCIQFEKMNRTVEMELIDTIKSNFAIRRSKLFVPFISHYRRKNLLIEWLWELWGSYWLAAWLHLFGALGSEWPAAANATALLQGRTLKPWISFSWNAIWEIVSGHFMHVWGIN